MQNLPPPQPMFCTANRNELLEVWNGFRKTRTVPHIYYKPVTDHAEEPLGFEEFNRSWREWFVNACRTARCGRQPVNVRFKTIPAFEGKVTPRIEPTAITGYEIHKRDRKGQAVPIQLLHVKFYYQERQARRKKMPHPQMLPRPDWRECERVQLIPGKWATLHTRFRTSGDGKKLLDKYLKECPDGFSIYRDRASKDAEEDEAPPPRRFRSRAIQG